MAIKIFNHNQLTQRPFFQQLIDFLASHDDVTLRQLRAAFPDEKNLERQIEDFVQSGLILRADKRYTNNFQVFDDNDFDLNLPASEPKNLSFDQPFFVNADSQLVDKIEQSQIQQVLSNSTNAISLHFSSNFAQTTDNLANYFAHVASNLPLSALETKIFKIIGDVNPDYALKYMTTFLLKFVKKERVKNKQPDIFIQTLELYGYIEKVDEVTYQSHLNFENREFETMMFDNARAFIAAQLGQTEQVADFVKIEM